MERQPHTFDKDQPSQLPAGHSHDETDAPPRPDEGERRKTKDDSCRSTDATMPPGEGRDPKRNTL